MTRRHAVALTLALGMFRGRDCGGVDSPSGKENAPCTRDRDCSSALVCREGVCARPDAGAGVGGEPAVLDAGDDG